MGKSSVVEKIVQSLSFQVEAVPQQFNQSASTSDHAPVNVKIRVRKRNEAPIQCGVISVPNVKTSGAPMERIRLISSDQTIMSFDLQMEDENDRKPLRKPRKRIFGILKPGGCLSTESDDDEYPYIPATSYNANLIKGSFNSNSDGIIKQNFTLSRRNYEDTRIIEHKDKIFLGKCKPGGCLDPPFSEEKYPYEPAPKKLFGANSIVKNESTNLDLDTVIKSKVYDTDKDLKKNSIEKKSNAAKQTNSVLSLYKTESLKTSISMSFSNSIITYPPELTSSQVLLHEEKNIKRRESDDRSKNSFMEFTDIYFPPKNAINRINRIANDLSVPEHVEIREHSAEFIESKEDTKVNKLKAEVREHSAEFIESKEDTKVNKLKVEVREHSAEFIESKEDTKVNELKAEVREHSAEFIESKEDTKVNKLKVEVRKHSAEFIESKEDTKVNKLKAGVREHSVELIESKEDTKVNKLKVEVREHSAELIESKEDTKVNKLKVEVREHSAEFIESKEDTKVNKLKAEVREHSAEFIESKEDTKVNKLKVEVREHSAEFIESKEDTKVNKLKAEVREHSAEFIESKEDTKVNKRELTESNGIVQSNYTDPVKNIEKSQKDLSENKYGSLKLDEMEVKREINTIPIILSSITVFPINAGNSDTFSVTQTDITNKNANKETNLRTQTSLIKLESETKIDYTQLNTSEDIKNPESEVLKISKSQISKTCDHIIENITKSKNSDINKLKSFENINDKIIIKCIESSNPLNSESSDKIATTAKSDLKNEGLLYNQKLDNIFPYKTVNDSGHILDIHSILLDESSSKSNKWYPEPHGQNKDLKIVTSTSTFMSNNKIVPNYLKDIEVNPVKLEIYNNVPQKLFNEIKQTEGVKELEPISLLSVQNSVKSLVNQSIVSSINNISPHLSIENLQNKYPSHQIIDNKQIELKNIFNYDKTIETDPHTLKTNMIDADVNLQNKDSVVISNKMSSTSQNFELDEDKSRQRISSKSIRLLDEIRSISINNTNTQDSVQNMVKNQEYIEKSNSQLEFADINRDDKELIIDQTFINNSIEYETLNHKPIINSENIKTISSTPIDELIDIKLLSEYIQSTNDSEKNMHISNEKSPEKEFVKSSDISAQSIKINNIMLDTKLNDMSHDDDDYNKVRVEDIVNNVDKSQLVMSQESQAIDTILIKQQSKISSSVNISPNNEAEYSSQVQMENKSNSLDNTQIDVLENSDKISKTSSTLIEVFEKDKNKSENEVTSNISQVNFHDITIKKDDTVSASIVVNSYDNTDNYTQNILINDDLNSQFNFENKSTLSESLSNNKNAENTSFDIIKNKVLNKNNDYTKSPIATYKIDTTDGMENCKKEDLPIEKISITESVLVKQELNNVLRKHKLNPDLNQQNYSEHDYTPLSLKTETYGTSEADTFDRTLYKTMSDATKVIDSINNKPKTIIDMQVIEPSYLDNELTNVLVDQNRSVKPNPSFVKVKEMPDGQSTKSFGKDELDFSQKYYDDHDKRISISYLSEPSIKLLNKDNKNDYISVDLAFQTYVNDKNDIIFKSFDSVNEPIRYQDDHITIIKSQMRLPDNEIKIPINPENGISIQIKKADIINEDPPVNEIQKYRYIPATSLNLDTEFSHQNILVKNGDKSTSDVKIHNTLITIYEQELVPLQKVIKSLKDDIDSLTDQQIFLKDKLINKRGSKLKLMHFNRKCGCIKRY